MPRGDAAGGLGTGMGTAGVDRDTSGTGFSTTGCAAGRVGVRVCVCVCICVGVFCSWGTGASGAGICDGVEALVGVAEPGVGGGGMTPFGGPYCMTGRSVFGGGGGFGSLTAYIVASKTCGSTVMVTWPSLAMLSFGGLFGSSITTPLRFVGFDQYFSNIPSLIHF